MDNLLSSQEALLDDIKIKQARIRNFLKENNYTGVVITSREQFAWVTSGGDNHVVRNSNLGFGSLVFTHDQQYLVAHTMDAARLLNEQVPNQGFELIAMQWSDGDIRSKAAELVGGTVVTDTDFDGMINVYTQLTDLHYPMTQLEVERLRWLGTTTDRLFSDFAQSVKPGETEHEIATKFHCAHLNANLAVDVLIVGSDEHCFLYRHPLPTHKPLEKYLMLHSSARRWGLHCNLTRFVHFGKPTEEIRKVYNAASNIAAKVILSLAPGVKFSEILAWQKQWYAEENYSNEWKNHFQGGPTGYVIVDAGRCFTNKVVQVNQPYEWFITVTGTKVGELVLLSTSGREILSYQDSSWPQLNINLDNFGGLSLPDILIRQL